MTSTTYPVDIQRWLWRHFTSVLDDETDYDRYNDRLVEAIATDVLRFNEAGLIDLDAGDQQRIEFLLEDLSSDDETVPALPTPSDQGFEAAGTEDNGVKPRGEQQR
jgi:hypothetical protein